MCVCRVVLSIHTWYHRIWPKISPCWVIIIFVLFYDFLFNGGGILRCSGQRSRPPRAMVIFGFFSFLSRGVASCGVSVEKGHVFIRVLFYLSPQVTSMTVYDNKAVCMCDREELWYMWHAHPGSRGGCDTHSRQGCLVKPVPKPVPPGSITSIVRGRKLSYKQGTNIDHPWGKAACLR